MADATRSRLFASGVIYATFNDNSQVDGCPVPRAAHYNWDAAPRLKRNVEKVVRDAVRRIAVLATR